MRLVVLDVISFYGGFCSANVVKFDILCMWKNERQNSNWKQIRFFLRDKNVNIVKSVSKRSAEGSNFFLIFCVINVSPN